MTNPAIKTIRHEVDQTISVYGPQPEGRFAGKRRPRPHLGMIFKPVSDRPGYLCSPSAGDQVTFQTEAEALDFFKHI